MSEDIVLYAVDGAIATVTLNRPQFANGQNTAMTYALDNAFRKAVDDDDVKVIIVEGAGKNFCAGHDVTSPDADHDKDYPRRASMWWSQVGRGAVESRYAHEYEIYLEMCRRWREIPKPTIAKVQGACFAGGLSLAWVCDIIVAADNAYFADPAAKFDNIGIEYFAHPWMMGPRFAKEFQFTGASITARQAHAWGMVNRVVPLDELEAETRELADQISTSTRLGLALTKRAINHAEDLMGLRSGMEHAFALHHLGHSHVAELDIEPDRELIKQAFSKPKRP